MKFFAPALMLILLTALISCQEVSNNEDTDTTKFFLSGNSGLTLDYLSKSINPGDDFYTYVNEGWIETTTLPAGYSHYGEINAMFLRTQEHLKEIIHKPNNYLDEKSSRKIRDLYKSYMDVEGIEKRGLTNIKGDMDTILGIKNYTQIAQWMAHPMSHSIVGAYVFADYNNPKTAVLNLDQQIIRWRVHNLPKDKKRQVRYKDYIVDILSKASITDAKKKALVIVELEKKLSAAQWNTIELADRKKNYHPMSRRDLQDYAPGFPWDEYLRAKNLTHIDYLVLNTDTAIKKSAAIFANTPIETWKAYLLYHWLQNHIDFLPEAFRQANRKFYGGWANRSREDRAVQFVNRHLKDLLGTAYIRKNFPDNYRQDAYEMTTYLRKAFRQSISETTWLDKTTRQEARKKLDAMVIELGHSDKLRNYSELKIVSNDPIGNLHRILENDWQREAQRASKTVKKWEWHFAPQTVDGTYTPQLNRILFPAGMLQTPSFTLNADPAANFGALGAVIGHEMGHGFDAQGALFDATGLMQDWWTPLARTSFNTRAQRLIAQYNGYEPIEGFAINGIQTLNENIADLTGVQLAYNAYQLYLEDKHQGQSPIIKGLTGEQRLFMGWAQFSRAIHNEGGLKNRIRHSYHAPPQYRVNGVVRNIDGWYRAFDINPKDKLYLPPEERVSFW